MDELHCIVFGRVQGVMYRDFIKRRARHLALVGYVKNLQDSSVEIVAQGSRDKLEELLVYVRRGSFLTRVSGVEIEWRDVGEPHKSFEVVF